LQQTLSMLSPNKQTVYQLHYPVCLFGDSWFQSGSDNIVGTTLENNSVHEI